MFFDGFMISSYESMTSEAGISFSDIKAGVEGTIVLSGNSFSYYSSFVSSTYSNTLIGVSGTISSVSLSKKSSIIKFASTVPALLIGIPCIILTKFPK